MDLLTQEQLASLLERRPKTPPKPDVSVDVRIAELAALLASRKLEALSMFRPLPHLAGIHESRAQYLILDGSNRSGKSESAAAEFAWAVTGTHPHGKYPKHSGKALVVGIDSGHLADPMGKKLFEPGSFKIIRDEFTREWRSVRPSAENPCVLDPYDAAYEEQWKDSPPLIPPRLLTEIAWDDRKKRVPAMARLTNGWEITFKSSEGNAKQGTVSDLGWFDEHLDNEEFFNEFIRGATQTRGVLIWSASLQNLNPQLATLRERADAGDPNVFAVKALISQNPYMPAEQKQEFYNSLSEEERQVRWYGVSAAATRRIYRNFDPAIHLCEPKVIPENWSVYIGVDPGTQHLATVFAAVDPDELHVWIFHAFDMVKDSVDSWARRVKDVLAGHNLEAMVIDTSAGRQRTLGSDVQAAQFYAEALERQKIVPSRLGPLRGFFRGSRDVAGREEALRSWLDIRSLGNGTGTPTLQIFRTDTGQLVHQIREAHYKHTKDKSKEVRNPNMPADLLEALEYLASVKGKIGYYPPETPAGETEDSYAWFQEIQRTNRLK